MTSYQDGESRPSIKVGKIELAISHEDEASLLPKPSTLDPLNKM